MHFCGPLDLQAWITAWIKSVGPKGYWQLAERFRFFCPILGNPRLDLLSRRQLPAVRRQHLLPGGALRRQAADLRRRHGPAAARQAALQDRKSVVEGKGSSVRVDLGGRSIIQKTIS